MLVCLKIWTLLKSITTITIVTILKWVMIICSGDALLMIMTDMRGDGWGWGVRALCDTDANKRGREIHKIHHHAAISILISIIIAFNSRVRSSFHRFKHHHRCTGVCVFGRPWWYQRVFQSFKPLCVAKLDLSQAQAVCKLVTACSAQCTVWREGWKYSSQQRSQPPIFWADICTKSE